MEEPAVPKALFLSLAPNIRNADFNYHEFGVINREAGVKRFIMSVG